MSSSRTTASQATRTSRPTASGARILTSPCPFMSRRHRRGEVLRDGTALQPVFRRRAQRRLAWIGQVDGEIGGDAAGAPGHDDDAVGEEYRFEDAVGDEDDGPALAPPQPQQILVELEPGDLVERCEGLV